MHDELCMAGESIDIEEECGCDVMVVQEEERPFSPNVASPRRSVFTAPLSLHPTSTTPIDLVAPS